MVGEEFSDRRGLNLGDNCLEFSCMASNKVGCLGGGGSGVSDKIGLAKLCGYNRGDRFGVSRSMSRLLPLRPTEVRLEFGVNSRERYKSSPGDSEKLPLSSREDFGDEDDAEKA